MLKKHHISGLYKKILIPIWVIAFFVVGLVIVYAINTWDTGYAVDKYGSGNVYGGNNWSSCKRVINNCNIGTWIFVPTKYDSEWDGANGFLAQKPACVTIAPCTCRTNDECRGGEVCSGYVAPVLNSWYCLHWEFDDSAYTESIYNKEYYWQWCIEGDGSTNGHVLPISNTPSFPSIPSFAPSYSWQIVNRTTIQWQWTIYFHCDLDDPDWSETDIADVWREAISTSATSCVWNTSHGAACTESTCTYLPGATIPAIPGQCVVCDANVWSSWSACSATCGWWTQTRTNECGTVQSQNCNIQACQFTNILTSISLSNEWYCSNWNWPWTPVWYTSIFTNCPYCGVNGDCWLFWADAHYRVSRKNIYTTAAVWSTCLVGSNTVTYSDWYFRYSYQRWILSSAWVCESLISTTSLVNSPYSQKTILYTTVY